MPIIDLQRRMVEAGRIRAGDYSDGHPRKLDKWRLTSKDRQRLDAAAQLWGGEVKEWEKRPGEFELYTETDALPIMLLPGHLPTTWYELWSKGGCQRRCDGQHEMLSDSACLCGEDKECKPTTRLSVMLPDLRGVGSWLVSSTGWNAAAELAGAAELLGRASAQGVLIPARLRLEQRVEVKQGQTRRYAVPVIDLDISFRELLGQQHELNIVGHVEPDKFALPVGYVPLTGNGGTGPTLEEGLHAAETQVATRSARSAAPIPAAEEIEFGNTPVPVPEETVVSGAASSTAEAAPPSGTKNATADQKPTPGQKKELGRIVRVLRDEKQIISTEQLWAWMARHRNIEVALMEDLVSGRDEDNVLHWGPLLKTLFRGEANALITALSLKYSDDLKDEPA